MSGSAMMRDITLSLPESLLEQVKESVEAGRVASEADLVTEALRRELKRIHDEELAQEFEEAGRDPEFLRDIEVTMEVFQYADAETVRMLDDGWAAVSVDRKRCLPILQS